MHLLWKGVEHKVCGISCMRVWICVDMCGASSHSVLIKCACMECVGDIWEAEAPQTLQGLGAPHDFGDGEAPHSVCEGGGANTFEAPASVFAVVTQVLYSRLCSSPGRLVADVNWAQCCSCLETSALAQQHLHSMSRVHCRKQQHIAPQNKEIPKCSQQNQQPAAVSCCTHCGSTVDYRNSWTMTACRTVNTCQHESMGNPPPSSICRIGQHHAVSNALKAQDL